MNLLIKNYITDVMGIQTMFGSLTGQQQKILSDEALVIPHLANCRLIFLRLDQADKNWSSEHQKVITNILKAMNLKEEEVWLTPPTSMTFVDLLSKLRELNYATPIVVMSHEPLIVEEVKSMGAHSWVEVYSVSEMIKRPEVKKTSWRILQEIMRIL